MSKTMVMIHGMWGGAWCWDHLKTFFEERGYRCHAPTLRHHEVNPKDQPDPRLGALSLDDYASDLEKFILGLDEKPIIVGHSMGGLLAQKLGARDLAAGLVLLTPASPSGINALKISVVKSFWDILTKWQFWKNPQRLSFDRAVYAMLHLLPQAEQKAVYDRLVYESGRAAAEIGFWLLFPAGASTIDEAKVTCPVLVVSGAEDRITPASVVKKVAQKYGRVSTYMEFPNHAHWIIGEPGWEKVAAGVLEWIDRVKI
ncbi:MAG: alpha/beta hydrolase [Pseudomonadota bacterium]